MDDGAGTAGIKVVRYGTPLAAIPTRSSAFLSVFLALWMT
jgi:hypothetical protein